MKVLYDGGRVDWSSTCTCSTWSGMDMMIGWNCPFDQVVGGSCVKILELINGACVRMCVCVCVLCVCVPVCVCVLVCCVCACECACGCVCVSFKEQPRTTMAPWRFPRSFIVWARKLYNSDFAAISSEMGVFCIQHIGGCSVWWMIFSYFGEWNIDWYWKMIVFIRHVHRDVERRDVDVDSVSRYCLRRGVGEGKLSLRNSWQWW